MGELKTTAQNTALYASVKSRLAEWPEVIMEEFDKVWSTLLKKIEYDQLKRWAEVGVQLASHSAHSWEVAAVYYKVSPQVVETMPVNYFLKWGECGSGLADEAAALAVAYFTASPATMSKLRSRHIESWASLGSSLYKGTWKSSTLSTRFFEHTPALLESLTFEDLERFVSFLDLLSRHSYDMAAECLSIGHKLLPLVGDNKEAFLSMSVTLVESGWRQVKSFFEASYKALPRLEESQRIRFLTLSEKMLNQGVINIPNTMLETSQAFSEIQREDHSRVLDIAEQLLDISPTTVPEFIKSSPPILERIPFVQLEQWSQEGMRILHQNKDGGLAYFKMESSRAEEFLENLSSAVDFARIKDVMEMYCRALAGATIKLSTADELVDKNIGWVSTESPSTEGSTVYLPHSVDRYKSKEENFSWFKVVSTHQVGHLEFGSFSFTFDTPSGLFKDLRMKLEELRQPDATKSVKGHLEDQSDPRGWVTDVQRFFGLFDDRRLILDLFTVVEDGRLDTRIKSEYLGIKNAYERVQADALAARPNMRQMPAREVMLELLVRLSLHQLKSIPVPKENVDIAQKVARVARRVFTRSISTVEDVAEATLRIYALISSIPNEVVEPEQWQDIDIEPEGDEGYSDPSEIEDLLEQVASGQDMESRPDGEEEYESSDNVDFRGDFKPELTQLLEMLRQQGQDKEEDGGEESQITQDMIQELLQQSAEMEMSEAKEGETQQVASQFAANMLKEAGMKEPQSPEYGQGPFVHVDEAGGELDTEEPQTFVYDEWDFRADDYKPRWCVVRQKMMAEGDPAYYSATLHAYGNLVAQIRRQFEMLSPEMFRKVVRLPDGEDIDIDAVIEAMVDIKTGASPSEKLYWRRNKVQRDVAVVFLLDTSASTAEAIDETRRSVDEWDAPDDPVEYMLWLRARRGEGMRRTYKRIIDLEKEALVLLTNALEAIGDVYGIYGFSGYGRENVEFYTIKDITEQFSDRVKKRIDRVSPLHATRMGPAIRHATTKLADQDARTKLLFLISDGRPQDRGYSREGVEKEYAVHDTRMALDEARRKDINAFCLTVDKNGHDYLKTMTQDMGYEVLDDIYTLPQRLLYLYKRLTM